MEHTTDSGIPLEVTYGPGDVPEAAAALPGHAPFTRGITPDGYRTAPWIMGQYGGFGTARETNERFKQLLAAGQTGFSVALDLPTQMGLDSDHALSAGEVGKVGVAIDSLADMEVLIDGLDLASVRQIRTTANAIGHVWLALVVCACRRAGVDPADIRILIQNDVLKEYVARGTYIHPPEAGLSIVADVVAYAAEHLPDWTPVTLSGYHIREAGADAVDEVAFSVANGIAYCDAAISRGLAIDDFAPSLFTFLSANLDLLEEVAKFRAARRVWHDVMTERYDAQDPASKAYRIFAFTAGSRLTSQQPLNNLTRTALEALSAVLGGVQTLHVSAYDEALGVPSTSAALTALRSQQILLEETSLTSVADPLGGSYLIEHLTDELTRRIHARLTQIAERGGAVACINDGWFQQEISDRAYQRQREMESGRRRVVGVNHQMEDSDEELRVFQPDPAGEREQVERLQQLRATRDQAVVDTALRRLERDARQARNIVPATIEAVDAYATVGEITDTLTRVYGRYLPQVAW
ncbi:MAG: methylmalonyl-CoA mutase [Nitriliruptoraceae bacterium]